MSRSTSSKTNKKTPYCATCHKAGLPENKYTNHWTRSSPNPDGVIVCPLILNTVCELCNEKGHWKKYCSKKNENHKNTNHLSAEIVSFKKTEFPSLINNNKEQIIKISSKKLYSQILLSSPVSLPVSVTNTVSKPPSSIFSSGKKYNIQHSWADDEYWE